MKKYKYHDAFTLAETLITLAIIGVVAALTIPSVIAKYQERQTITKVKKFYSDISQAYNSAVAENGASENWGWTSGATGSDRIMDIFARYLKVVKKCGSGGLQEQCFNGIGYKTLNPNVYFEMNPATYNRYSVSILNNGMIFWTWSSHTKCNEHYGQGNLYYGCGYIGVDINGLNPPNIYGQDTFSFWITKYGIVPMGTKSDSYYPLYTRCKIDGQDTRNGPACTAWIISKSNMNYIHRDVRW